MNTVSLAKALNTIRSNGWVLVECEETPAGLLDLACSFGEPVAAPGRPIVQVLRPNFECTARPNTTSAIHGLRAFPPHTDFAHWPVPPRLLFFRSIGRPSKTPTLLLSFSKVRFDERFGGDWRRAVWQVRRIRRNFLCSAAFETARGEGYRWDSDVMIPYGELAERVAPEFSRALEVALHRDSEAIHWKTRSAALIVDNWRTLHARTAVASVDNDRALERIAIMEIQLGEAQSPISLDT